MAKVDLTQALATLRAAGIELTDAQQNDLAAAQVKESLAAAIEYLDSKVTEETDTTEFAERLFDLAENFSDVVDGRNKARGRGEVFERVVNIETPWGHFKVALTNEKQ